MPQDKHLVMVIDDDTRVLRALDIALRAKFAVKTFPRAALALQEIDRRNEASNEPPVCAIILDIKMPEMDGFTAFKEIRQRWFSVPIIFNSAYQDLQDPDAVKYQYGPYGYMSKGSNLKEFVDMVQSAVDSHNAYLAGNGTTAPSGRR